VGLINLQYSPFRLFRFHILTYGLTNYMTFHVNGIWSKFETTLGFAELDNRGCLNNHAF
jgi:hypothetical protein